jgi:hypothetical protein
MDEVWCPRRVSTVEASVAGEDGSERRGLGSVPSRQTDALRRALLFLKLYKNVMSLPSYNIPRKIRNISISTLTKYIEIEKSTIFLFIQKKIETASPSSCRLPTISPHSPSSLLTEDVAGEQRSGTQSIFPCSFSLVC